MSSIALLLPLLAGADTEERLLPPTTLADFAGTEARALDDYLGQVVLVDFFAHWCAPCARLVPHLNELAEAYAPQGLNVLGVTGDDAATAAEWLKKLEARYAYARDVDLQLEIELGFRPLPFAVLVDPFGVIVWQGNPADLPMEKIEALLSDALAQPAHGWPAGAQAVREALRAKKYGEAETRARDLPEHGPELARFVRRFVTRRLELVEAMWARGDVLGTQVLGSELVDGLPQGDAVLQRVSAVLAQMKDKDELLEVLNGQRRLRETWKTVGTVGTSKQADELAAQIQTLADAHRGTYVERTAKSHLETIAALKSILR